MSNSPPRLVSCSLSVCSLPRDRSRPLVSFPSHLSSFSFLFSTLLLLLSSPLLSSSFLFLFFFVILFDGSVDDIARSGGMTSMKYEAAEASTEGETETGEPGRTLGGEREVGGDRRGVREGASVVTEMNTISGGGGGGDDESLLHAEVGAKRDKELFDMVEKLYSLRNDPAYPNKPTYIIYIYKYKLCNTLNVEKVCRSRRVLLTDPEHPLSSLRLQPLPEHRGPIIGPHCPVPRDPLILTSPHLLTSPPSPLLLTPPPHPSSPFMTSPDLSSPLLTSPHLIILWFVILSII